MNETETRADLIDPALVAAGWGVVDDSRIRREYPVTKGRIQTGGRRASPLFADYVLFYRGKRLAAIEAKSDEKDVGEGVAQAKDYAIRLNLLNTFSANGKEIYRIRMGETLEEGLVDRFPTPQELWDDTFAVENPWRDRFAAEPFNDIDGSKPVRSYQENAVEAVLDAVANEQDRLLLTLATGTGKTFIAFQIIWKLFQTRWSLQRDGSRRPRILFLAGKQSNGSGLFSGNTTTCTGVPMWSGHRSYLLRQSGAADLNRLPNPFLQKLDPKVGSLHLLPFFSSVNQSVVALG